ncbi:sensor histidine kinase [Actinomadura parmotrematis]|uniref:histidine kinase n=1 Tax=Actinomadura parmotrematis TaxID=2864039 RepID=A0ABS7FRL2_9ACTN|nr:HAMP domain-containing sensor histidine kinase [Actinomadura parmotrematis]MBW8483001.1 HAMP domain-containing histidine kinase [Actinomadura parmotrematis]
MRLRPRSIRGRDTLVAAVLALLVFGAIAAAADVSARNATDAARLQDVQLAARRASGGVRDGTLATPIPDDSRGRVLVQVLGPGGHLLDATPAAAGRPAPTRRWPPPAERVQDFTECRGRGPGGACWTIEAIRVTTAPDSVVVYAARRVPQYLVSGLLEALLAAAVLLLSALVAWVTWRVVGRTLRPVEQIRVQLSEISASDLSRRVPAPAGEDEIAQLARTANETLDRLERAVARQRQFASDASHELRTPIAGLRANLEDAAMHPGDTDLGEVVTSALRDTDRLESIVTDLLLLARIGTGGTAAQEDVDLGALARAEIERRAGAAGTAVEIAAELAPDVRVRGVRMQLVRLLNNLLDNAVRFAGTRVEVTVAADGGRARLAVADDGPGIPAADRERVFERFTRLDTARSRGAGGFGLGLAIAREIAEAHGGTLRVADSASGARLELDLPPAEGEDG